MKKYRVTRNFELDELNTSFFNGGYDIITFDTYDEACIYVNKEMDIIVKMAEENGKSYEIDYDTLTVSVQDDFIYEWTIIEINI